MPGWTGRNFLVPLVVVARNNRLGTLTLNQLYREKFNSAFLAVAIVQRGRNFRGETAKVFFGYFALPCTVLCTRKKNRRRLALRKNVRNDVK